MPTQEKPRTKEQNKGRASIAFTSGALLRGYQTTTAVPPCQSPRPYRESLSYCRCWKKLCTRWIPHNLPDAQNSVLLIGVAKLCKDLPMVTQMLYTTWVQVTKA
ncbi:hypothetical protein EVAR_64268_1 [Eumeta japonica]|uniref:Uncharacterized protein n=1 Tax=Eumeta variegata TaxID=151549 RepID=A0A4C2A977_EUMVA|nr:hypothetical protein EVAR_64268_1 [Eumeta japonica]